MALSKSYLFSGNRLALSLSLSLRRGNFGACSKRWILWPTTFTTSTNRVGRMSWLMQARVNDLGSRGPRGDSRKGRGRPRPRIPSVKHRIVGTRPSPPRNVGFLEFTLRGPRASAFGTADWALGVKRFPPAADRLRGVHELFHQHFRITPALFIFLSACRWQVIRAAFRKAALGLEISERLRGEGN